MDGDHPALGNRKVQSLGLRDRRDRSWPCRCCCCPRQSIELATTNPNCPSVTGITRPNRLYTTNPKFQLKTPLFVSIVPKAAHKRTVLVC